MATAKKKAKATPTMPPAIRNVTAALLQLERRVARTAKEIRQDVTKRVERRGRDVEARAQQIVSRVEKQVLRAVQTAIRGLDLATQRDVRRLQARVAKLERERAGAQKAEVA